MNQVKKNPEPSSCSAFDWFIFAILLAFTGCSSQISDLDKPVATWRGISIDADHFIKEYELFGTYSPSKDDPETRQFYAKVMLERQIIAEIGRKNSLDTLKIVKETIRRRKEMAMRRHYLNMMVKPHIADPTEDEIRTAFNRNNTRIYAQQIFAPSKEIADSLYSLILSGADFDTVAEQSMISAGMQPGTAGYMGWVTFNQLDEKPEEVLFGLKQYEIAPPVQSLRGFHIFRALEVEETVFFDQSTFNNIRDRLKHQVFHRRFDEASADFIRAEVMSQDLAVDMRMLYEAYLELRPALPTKNQPEEIIRFNNELHFLKPQLDEATPLAYVNGQPFTYGQFLYQLPDIPVEWVVSDFRHALEIAIRDSILAAHSVVARPDTSLDVRVRTKMAEYTAMYYATLQAGMDTIKLEPLKSKYYDVWKNEQFIEFHTTLYKKYTFRDSLRAINAIKDFKETQNWYSTLYAGDWDDFEILEESLTTFDAPRHPVHRLQVNDPESSATITGPFPTERGFTIYKATERTTTYTPFEQVEDRLMELLKDRSLMVVHRQYLPDDYNPDDVILDTELLKRLIPFYF